MNPVSEQSPACSVDHSTHWLTGSNSSMACVYYQTQIRWQDLNEKWKDRLKEQLFTAACTVAAIAVIAVIVRLCNEASVVFAAYAIAIFNSPSPCLPSS